MNNYEQFTLEDFIQDHDFINWVKTKDEALNRFWESWVEAHPDKKQLVLEAKAIVRNLKFSAHEISAAEKDLLWNHISSGIRQEKPQAKVVKMPARRRWLYAAAASVALLLTGWFGFNEWQHGQETSYQAGFGEKMNIELPDGSGVVLNANSKLRFFNENPRKVWLEGEAFFSIEKKPGAAHPDFLVITPDLTVRVLGTSFNVNSRNDETKVFLEEGKVELEVKSETNRKVLMEPGEVVSYSKKTKKQPEKHRVSAVENTSWKDGSLMFKQTPLPEVCIRLSEIYGVPFEMKNEELKTKLITGGVPIKNLEIALATLQNVYDVKIEKAGGKYLIGN